MLIYERITGIFFMLLAVAVVLATQEFPTGSMGDPGPQLFPVAIAVMMFPMGLVLAIKRSTRSKPLQDEELGEFNAGRPDMGRLLLAGVLLLSMVAFVLIVEYLGTMVGIVTYLWGATWLLGERSFKAALRYLVFALIMGGALYVILYRFFQLSLPAGILI
ncbi:tripartite tricarboxylate transporter TctB family protein [Halomonas sp.]|uniref:tripartite tricarboxylate transporter TctB family protein n=1 Tax=Halomonas sp. TaxID=1486246 RepID=UPI003A94DA02